MLQALTYIGLGILVLIGIVIVAGGFTLLMHKVVDPALKAMGRKYPTVALWISGIILTSAFIFIVYYLGKMVMGGL